MIRNFLKYFLPIILFVAVAYIIFYPALMGYQVKMYDIQAYVGNSKELSDYKEWYDQSSQWTGTSFSGMPSYQMFNDFVSPISYFYSLISLFNSYPISCLFIAFICFYILALCLKFDILIATIASLIFGLTTYHFSIIEVGHSSKMNAIAIFPAVLGLFILLYKSKGIILLLLGTLFSLLMGIELLVNHIQMTYYFCFVLLALLIMFFIKQRKSELKHFFYRTSVVFIAGGFALLMNFSNYYLTYSFSKNTIRGPQLLSENQSLDSTLTEEEKAFNEWNKTSGINRDEIVFHSYGIPESYNLIVANAKGAEYLKGDMINHMPKEEQQKVKQAFNGYWGNQPGLPNPNYIGGIIIMLALCYILFVHNSLKWALLGVTVLALLLGWGRNLGGIQGMWLTDFFIDYVPLYSKFRAVGTFFVVLNLTLPLMAFLFIREIFSHNDWALLKSNRIYYVSSTFIITIAFLGFFSSALFNFISYDELDKIKEFNVDQNVIDLVKDYRLQILQWDTWKTVFLMILSLILVYLIIHQKIKKPLFIIVISLLIIGDKVYVNGQILNNSKDPQTKTFTYWNNNSDGYANAYLATKADIEIYNLEATDKIKSEVEDRLNTLRKIKDSISRYDIESIKFSSLNFNTSYRVIDYDKPFYSSSGARASYFHKSAGGYSAVMLRRYDDIINHYLLAELEFLKNNDFERTPLFNMLNTKYVVDTGILIGINNHIYGNCWFVKNIKWAQNNDEEINLLASSNLKEEVVLHKEFKDQLKKLTQSDSTSNIKLISYKPNHLTYSANCKSNELAVFSEVYYKDGWVAYMDGKVVPYFRANYILRAMEIPKGEHTIEFKFKPDLYEIGNKINVASFYFVLVLFLIFLLLHLIKLKRSGYFNNPMVNK